MLIRRHLDKSKNRRMDQKKKKNTGDGIAASRHLSTAIEKKNLNGRQLENKTAGKMTAYPKVMTPTVHTLNRGHPEGLKNRNEIIKQARDFLNLIR